MCGYFNWWDPVWPEGMEKYLSPNVSVRMRGVVEKCSFCFHRYQLAKDKAYAEGRRELAEEEYQTACTQACPAGAITFGDLNNPKHKVYKLKNDPNAPSACWSAGHQPQGLLRFQPGMGPTGRRQLPGARKNRRRCLRPPLKPRGSRSEASAPGAMILPEALGPLSPQPQAMRSTFKWILH
jgi:ferredoxin